MRTAEGGLFQTLAGYKLELGAMIASGRLFAFKKFAGLTYGQAFLALGYYFRTKDKETPEIN